VAWRIDRRALLLWSSHKDEIKRPIRLLLVRHMIDIAQEVVLKNRARPWVVAPRRKR
jgi:hypothetical protein